MRTCLQADEPRAHFAPSCFLASPDACWPQAMLVANKLAGLLEEDDSPEADVNRSGKL